MATLIQRTEVELADGELLGLTNVRGARLHCVEGSVWLTLDRDCRDIFLGPGERFVVDRSGLTLLHAMAPARLRVDFCADAARSAPSALRQWLARLGTVGGWRSAASQLARAARPMPCEKSSSPAAA
jgi:hypothetical protein